LPAAFCISSPPGRCSPRPPSPPITHITQLEVLDVLAFEPPSVLCMSRGGVPAFRRRGQPPPARATARSRSSDGPGLRAAGDASGRCVHSPGRGVSGYQRLTTENTSEGRPDSSRWGMRWSALTLLVARRNCTNPTISLRGMPGRRQEREWHAARAAKKAIAQNGRRHRHSEVRRVHEQPCAR
jgi:hypothetical protein